jgi:hypothetical protein
MDTSEPPSGVADGTVPHVQGQSSSGGTFARSARTACVQVAVTPGNPNPQTPRGIELVAAIKGS